MGSRAAAGRQTLASTNFFEDGRCLIVAEVAQAHDGSVGLAHSFIDAAAKAGAEAVKFQTHLAEAESTPSEPWRVRFSSQDETRYDYWKRMEFTPDQWRDLRDHASASGLLFASSPFSLQAVELLDDVDVDFFKVASGELTNRPLLDAIAATGRSVALSSGMSPWHEIDEAVGSFDGKCDLAVLQCTSEYPCPPERVGLNIIQEMRERYGLPVGLSDHSGTIFPGLAAAAMSVAALEVHLTLSRDMFGPDVPASITTDEMGVLVEGVRFIESALANPVDKDRIVGGMSRLRASFMKSPVTVRDLGAGHTLTQQDVALKKPGNGLPPDTLPELIGRVLARPLPADHQLMLSDLMDADS